MEEMNVLDLANEPIGGGTFTRDSVDGLMAYIMSVSPSVNTRKALGRRLLWEAERDAEQQKNKLKDKVRQIGAHANWPKGIYVKPSGFAVRNAIGMIDCMPNASFLERVAPYPTDHATIMLKWVLGNIVATVDAGKDKFTYAIINITTADGMSGEGSFKGTDDIEAFYSHLQTATL